MRMSGAFLAVALLAVAWVPALASPFTDAANYLHGIWQGDGYVLRVDAARAQASVDAGRPFQWTRFLVKEVTGQEIVFSVGADIFEARVDDDTIVLTSTGFRGERTLRREAPAP